VNRSDIRGAATPAPAPAQAVGQALTGDWLAGADVPAGASPTRIVAWLGTRGWPAARLASARDEARLAGLPWPRPVPAGERGGLGAAQFQTLLRECLLLLGLDHEPPVLRDLTAAPGAADRRLAGEVPPHHGRVG